jgi:hypothetical protein
VNLVIGSYEFRGDDLKQISVSFSTGSKASLFLTKSRMLNVIGR